MAYTHRPAVRAGASHPVQATTMDENVLTTYLESHPRMMGALFTLVLLIANAGTALAGTGVVATHGP